MITSTIGLNEKVIKKYIQNKEVSDSQLVGDWRGPLGIVSPGAFREVVLGAAKLKISYEIEAKPPV